MTIYLDSADLDDAKSAADLGFVAGITTNPTLMRAVTTDPLRHLEKLLTAVDFGELYYQPCGGYGGLAVEAVEAWSLDPDRVVIKLPATPNGVRAAVDVLGQGAPVSLTAAQTSNAMIVARAIGAASVIPYVDRALRDQRTESGLVAALAALRQQDKVRIVAASLKNLGQFASAYADGADAVAAPLALLAELLRHPAALDAESVFAAEYGGQRLALAGE
jgi:transaldolase